jgi:hypothetical protein
MPHDAQRTAAGAARRAAGDIPPPKPMPDPQPMPGDAPAPPADRVREPDDQRKPPVREPRPGP